MMFLSIFHKSGSLFATKQFADIEQARAFAHMLTSITDLHAVLLYTSASGAVEERFN